MEVLENGHYYHIYNRGVNSETLFQEKKNYSDFLQLYQKYISPIADTYAYCLMNNHFHFLIRIKEKIVYKYSKVDFPNINRPGSIDVSRFDQVKWETTRLSTNSTTDKIKRKIPNPSKHFSHFFNAYASYYKRIFYRTGPLFERPFKRNHIENQLHLKNLVYYIHHNPVKHGFIEDMAQYKWSSYKTILSGEKSFLNTKEVIDWFGDMESFRQFHIMEQDLDKIKKHL
ncbi:MAG: hypothetical protein R6U66_08370 [Bacteroidales bacterium]